MTEESTPDLQRQLAAAKIVIADLTAEIGRLNFQRQILQSESDRLRRACDRLRTELTRGIVSQGCSEPKY